MPKSLTKKQLKSLARFLSTETGILKQNAPDEQYLKQVLPLILEQIEGQSRRLSLLEAEIYNLNKNVQLEIARDLMQDDEEINRLTRPLRFVRYIKSVGYRAPGDIAAGSIQNEKSHVHGVSRESGMVQARLNTKLRGRLRLIG